MGSSQSIENEFQDESKDDLRLSTFSLKKTNSNFPMKENVLDSDAQLEHESIRQSGTFGKKHRVSLDVYSLLTKIATRNWKEVEIHVQLNPQDMAASLRMTMYGIERKLTPFHLLCAFDPPLSLVERIILYPPTKKCVTIPLMNSSSSSNREVTIPQNEDWINFHTLAGNDTLSNCHPNRETDNLLPLHIATLYGASTSVIQSLLKHYPSAAKYKDGMGMLPIHIVCSGMRLNPPTSRNLLSSASYVPSGDIVETVHLLLRAFPESVHVPCSSISQRDNKTPIQYVNDCLLPRLQEDEGKIHCTKNQVNKILDLLSSNLSTLKPLQEGLLESDIVLSNRKTCGQSLIISDSSRKKKGSISALMGSKKNPSDLKDPLKLYNYIMERKWNKAMQQLARCPEEAKCWVFIENHINTANNVTQSLHLNDEVAHACHRLPIHRACTNKPPVEIIVALHSAYPDAVQFREKFGMLPLHVACNNGASVDVISTLISQYPQAVKEKDAFGLLPLHIACTEGASIDVISELMRAYPESAEVEDSRGIKPYQYVTDSFHPNKSAMLKALRRAPGYWKAETYVNGEVNVPLYALLKVKEWSGANLFLDDKPDSARVWVIDEESSWSDGYPCTPLHVACSNRAPEELVKRLISLYPESINMSGGKYDVLPLHAACANGATLGVVKVLVDACPDSVNETDSFGLLPLHVAVCSVAKIEVIRALSFVGPECVNVKDSSGTTPLEYAKSLVVPNKGKILEALHSCNNSDVSFNEVVSSSINSINVETTKSLSSLIDDKKWGEIPNFVASFPVQARMISVGYRGARSFAQFPIHRVCSMKPPSAVVVALIDAYPFAVQSKTDFNEFPLHVASKYGASFGVINTLLKAFKGATSVSNSNGRTPLHLAAIAGTDPSVLELLLKASPGAARLRDTDGYTPLDYLQGSHHRNKTFLIDVFERHKSRVYGTSAVLYDLVKDRKWDEINDRLSKNSSEAKVWIIDQGYGFGRLALHLACSLNPPIDVIEDLHKSNRKAISTSEKDGRYPLHVACQHGASVQVVEFLIDMYPDALSIKDNFGLLPIHFACSEGATMDVVKLLLRSAPNSIFQKDGRGWTPLDYSALTRSDHRSIVAITPKLVPQLIRCNSLPSRIDFETMLEEKHQESDVLQKTENNYHRVISGETKESDPMTRRDIYHTFGISKSARFAHKYDSLSDPVLIPPNDVEPFKEEQSSEIV